MKTSWKCLEDIFARLLQHVLDTSSRHLCKTNIFLLIKTFSRRLLKTYEQGEYIDLDQDVLKTSSEEKHKKRLQDVFTKTKICWEVTWVEVWRLSSTWIVRFFWEITLSTNLCVKSSRVAFAVWVRGVAPSCIKHCWLITISHPTERCI